MGGGGGGGGGGEGLKVAGREDVEPEDSGVSDLISSE